MLAKDIRVGDFIDGKEIIHVSHGTRHVFFEDEDGESYEALFTIDCNAVSVSKKRLPIKGDIILVRDFSSVKWKKLIFLMFYGDTAFVLQNQPKMHIGKGNNIAYAVGRIGNGQRKKNQK